MKSFLIFLALCAGLLGAVYWMQTESVNQGSEKSADALKAESRIAKAEVFSRLFSPNSYQVDVSLEQIADKWHPGSLVMLLEVAQFKQEEERGQIFNVMEEKSGQEFGADLDRWYEWIWKHDYNPHPEYAEFKRLLYSNTDWKFAEYFHETESATIRLDEIRWGGVARDGIPPLKNPEMILADEAGYLADTDVVFGIALYDDARCYPKRILAWHEMFKDTIGGESVCGVY